MVIEFHFIMGMPENENKGEIQRWRDMRIKEFISKLLPDIITVQETKKNGTSGACSIHTELCSET